MFIATVTRTKYRPNGKVDFKLVKGQEVKASVLRKLKDADRVAWTRKLDKAASINRRIVGRQNTLENLGFYSDVNLEAMMHLSNLYTNRELLDKRSGQNGLVASFEKQIIEHFGFQDRLVNLTVQDDCKEGVVASRMQAWPLTQAESEAVREFLETL